MSARANSAHATVSVSVRHVKCTSSVSRSDEHVEVALVVVEPPPAEQVSPTRPDRSRESLPGRVEKRTALHYSADVTRPQPVRGPHDDDRTVRTKILTPVAPPRILDDVYTDEQYERMLDVVKRDGPWGTIISHHFETVDEVIATISGVDPARPRPHARRHRRPALPRLLRQELRVLLPRARGHLLQQQVPRRGEVVLERASTRSRR